MKRWTLAVAAAAFCSTTLPLASDHALAQVRCEPTITNPCKPPAHPPAAPEKNAEKPRDPARLPDTPQLPEIKIDNDTSAGFGRGGGVIGLERKF
jgi:hypothetical protein